MSMSSKVFIYNAKGTASQSVADLKQLFSSEAIFPTKPDVIECDFNFNLSQLSQPTFVVPGGATSLIGTKLREPMKHIKNELGENFNYVGVCAGAFVATANAHTFVTPHSIDLSTGKFEHTYLYSTSTMKWNLDLISDYKAIGAFYPDKRYCRTEAKTYMPYCVNVQLTESQDELLQLYAAGPGFVPTNLYPASNTEVVGNYKLPNPISFEMNESKTDNYNTMASMIRQPRTKNKGGVFLTGTHIETCVQDSQFLRFFHTKTDMNESVSKEENRQLTEQRSKTKEVVESLLKTTLN